MQSRQKSILTELMWVTISLVLTITLASVFFGWSFVTGQSNLHVHDTYMAVSHALILTALFSLLTFCVYFFRSKRKSFAERFATLLTLASGFTTIILLTLLIHAFSKFLIGWSVFSPIAIQGHGIVLQDTSNPLTESISHWLMLVQFIILCLLVYASYYFGISKGRALAEKS